MAPQVLGKGLVSPSGRAVNSLTTGRGYAKSVGLKIGWARWELIVLLCEADASARRRKEASVQSTWGADGSHRVSYDGGNGS